MTLEEYLGQLNDRLMLEISNMSEMPEMYDWVVFQIIEKALELMKEDYLLTHKSHIRIMQVYDLSNRGYLTRADIMAMGSDICPDVEIMYSRLSMEDLLKQHEDWTVDELIRYLEAPKPGQTQPAHP
jgi:hypothetical protein